MVDQKLRDIIIEKFKKGQTKKKVKDYLIDEGYTEREIDEAIFQIHKEAFRQVPVIGKVINWWEDFEEEASHLSPGKAVLLLIALALFLISVVFFINNV